MSNDNNLKKAAQIGMIGLALVNGASENKTIPEVPNEPSYSQVQTTEAKCDPLAKQSQDLNKKNPTEIPKSTGELADAKEQSDDQKRDQIDKDITADNQPTISGSPPELTSCPVPSEDKYAQLQEPLTASGVTDPELRVNTPILETNNNADLANQLRSETFSPSSQSEPQEVNGDSGNIA